MLANDTNADGNPLTAVLNAGPDFGGLVFNSDGSFSYTSDAGFFGTDSFTYYDTNGLAQSNVATVSFTVYSIPIAVEDSYAAVENQQLVVDAVDGVLANDANADGNSLTVVLTACPPMAR